MSNVDKWLLCCDSETATHDDILLPDGEVVIVGRGPITKIKDQKLSRHHVEFQANYHNETVIIRQLGPNPSTVNGRLLTRGQTQSVQNGSKICLLYDQYSYIVKSPTKQIPALQPEDTVDSQDICSNPKHSTLSKHSKVTLNCEPRKRSLHDFWGSKQESENTSNCLGGKKSKIEVAQHQVSEDDSHSEEVEAEEEEAEEARVQNSAQKLAEMRRIMTKDRRASSTGMRRSISLPLGPVTNGVAKFGFPKVPGDEWEECGRLAVYTCKGSIPREKIAGFDVDWTIIGTKSGKVFPVGPDDWRILYSEVLKKLRQLFEDDYKIVFFSNQRGISKGTSKFEDFKRKIQNVIAKIGVPVQVLVSTGMDIYRKPAPGMWSYLVDVGNEGLAIDVDSSFYVGDAAGRPANWGPGKKKKDFASGDRLFALNIGLKFYTPEEFFLDQKPAPFSLPEFDPRALNPNAPLFVPSQAKLIASRQEVIVIMGYPASGKSHFVLRHLVPHAYVHVNRDLLGSWQKCISVTQESLQKGKSVVVDNTNPDSLSRKRYIECARVARVQCRCFLMAVSYEHARHNNKFRQLTSPEQIHHQVNDMVLNAYKAKFEEPRLHEGFSEIVHVNFVPRFEDEKLRKLYPMFLIEK